MAGITKRTTAFDDENLSGRSQKLYFEVTEEEIIPTMVIMKLTLIKEPPLIVKALMLMN